MYTINDTACFKPESRSLDNVPLGIDLKIQRPACRCLEYLLKNRGVIVSQRELMKYAWGEEKEKIVSTNNFYQAMHQLRNALESVGCPDIIDTIPRKGLIIDKRHKISFVIDDVPDKKPASDSFFKYWHMIVSGLTVTLLITFYLLLDDESDAFAGYKPVKIGHCAVYVSDAYIRRDSLLRLLKYARLNCEEMTLPRKIYVTIKKNNIRNSLMICTQKEERICHTIFVMNEEITDEYK